MGTFEDLGLEYSSVTALLGLFVAAFIILGILSLIFYVLKAAAVCDMLARKNLKNSWYSFIPVIRAYAFGRLASGKNKALAVGLLVLEVITCLLAVAVMVTALFGWVDLIFAADKALAAGEKLSAEAFSVISYVSLPLLILLPVMLAKKILNIICAWRIFDEFEGRRATFYTVLSVIFPVILPIFLFSVKNNEPRIRKKDRDDSIASFNFG